jgi:uncharacterized protein YkuJ
VFSDAVDREAAWLSTSGDGLPALRKSDGGPFQILQPRWPRVPSSSKTGLYVLRAPSGSHRIERFAAIRSMPMTMFTLHLFWPMTNGQGSAETEQLNFEQAIDLVLARIEGFPGDKTHGGRFMAVGEPGITVNYDDVEQAMQTRIFRASISYSADDMELTN